jgi:hypothetical protein
MSKQPVITYKIERNSRMQSYKSKYNCEILSDGKYVGDAQGDTASAAKFAAEAKVRGWARRDVAHA